MFTRALNQIFTFLFEVKYREGLGFMRFLLGACLFYLACSRQLNIDQYGLDSIIPRSEALSIYPDFYRPSIEFFFWPDQYAWIFHLIYIVLVFLFMTGLSNRLLMFITWVLAQGFINRNYSILFGADLIGTLFLFYLAFTDCNKYFSLKNRLFDSKKSNSTNYVYNSNSWDNLISSTFFRLMQFQICIIYAYTGFEKLKGATWWDGTALWTVFANPQFVNYDFIFLRNFPLFFALGTFITIVFEVYFPAMVAFKKTRLLWLALGVLFHSSIAILISLWPFSLAMISVYFLFLDKESLSLLKKSMPLVNRYL